jgi:hypothetical protein
VAHAALERIERYLDAVPRAAADAESVGPFTLFRSRGPWPYYARPRLGLSGPVTSADVSLVARRQRELGLPATIEWLSEVTPSLEPAARAAGLDVQAYPLMVLDDVTSLFSVVPPEGVAVRLLAADDSDFAAAHAVAAVGFGAPGTAVGPHGTDAA